MSFELPDTHPDAYPNIKTLVEEAHKTGNIIRVPCKNSYERRIAHDYANKLGLQNRTIIDYNNMYIHCYKESYNECDYFYDVYHDGEVYKLNLATSPTSFVEINNGNDKLTIGDATLLPKPIKTEALDYQAEETIDFYKGKLNERHELLLNNYKRTHR
jgi:hypothetical protein